MLENEWKWNDYGSSYSGLFHNMQIIFKSSPFANIGSIIPAHLTTHYNILGCWESAAKNC